MKRLALLFGSTLLVLASACTIGSKAAPLDLEEDDKPSNTTPSPSGDDGTIEGTEGEKLDIPSAAPDEGTTPENRPTPRAGGGVRTCAEALTAATPLRRSRIYTKTNAVKLGAAVIDNKPSATTFWATGTTTPPASTTTQNTSASGPDVDKLAELLGWTDESYDLYQTHISGRNAVQIWADAMTPTSRRMTYTFVKSAKQQPYKLASEKRGAGAPTNTDDKYVRYLSASKSVGISLVVTTASDCATGALADLLGRQPVVKGENDATANTLFDLEKREAIQKLLVRDGAEVMLAAITSRADTKIDALVKETTCSPTDLTACEKTFDALVDASENFMSAQGAATYDTLSAGTDPTWAFTTFTAGDVKTLAP